MADADEREVRDGGSTWYLFGLWFLLGSSLLALGTAVLDTTGWTPPLSRLGTGLTVATAGVAALWIAGIRPSLWDGWKYFIAQTVLNQFGLLVTWAAGFAASTDSPATVGRHALSILLAAALVFSGYGRALGRTVRERVRRWTAPEYRSR